LVGVNGFYRVDSFKQDNGILSEISLNPESTELPYLVYRFYDSEDKLISAYKSARITEFSTYKKEVGDIFIKWKNSKIVKSPDYTRMVTVFFNTSDQSVFFDRDMRKAFVYSLSNYAEFGTKAISPIQPILWAYNKNTRIYSEDLDRARELFSGDQNATESSKISLYTFYDYLKVAEKMKEDVERVGFSVSVNVVSYIPEKFDILLTSWSPPVDPDQYYYWHSSQQQGNITKINNPRIDKILEDGRKTFNKDDRKDLYFEFQRIFMEELPAYFLYHPFEYTIKRK
jgi:ABC-type transport system substrate-binding protein